MYISVFKHLLLITLLTASLSLIPDQSFSKDITEQVIKETPLDEHITLFCLTHCLGNERKGSLKSVTVNPTEHKNLHTVKGKAALRNRQVAHDPFNVTVFDRTIIVNSIGTLNEENCELRVDDVTIENDFQNIVTNLLKSNSDVVGKVVKVPNCKTFLN